MSTDLRCALQSWPGNKRVKTFLLNSCPRTCSINHFQSETVQRQLMEKFTRLERAKFSRRELDDAVNAIVLYGAMARTGRGADSDYYSTATTDDDGRSCSSQSVSSSSGSSGNSHTTVGSSVQPDRALRPLPPTPNPTESATLSQSDNQAVEESHDSEYDIAYVLTDPVAAASPMDPVARSSIHEIYATMSTAPAAPPRQSDRSQYPAATVAAPIPAPRRSLAGASNVAQQSRLQSLEWQQPLLQDDIYETSYMDAEAGALTDGMSTVAVRSTASISSAVATVPATQDGSDYLDGLDRSLIDGYQRPMLQQQPVRQQQPRLQSHAQQQPQQQQQQQNQQQPQQQQQQQNQQQPQQQHQQRSQQQPQQQQQQRSQQQPQQQQQQRNQQQPQQQQQQRNQQQPQAGATTAHRSSRAANPGAAAAAPQLMSHRSRSRPSGAFNITGSDNCVVINVDQTTMLRAWRP